MAMIRYKIAWRFHPKFVTYLHFGGQLSTKSAFVHRYNEHPHSVTEWEEGAACSAVFTCLEPSPKYGLGSANASIKCW